MALEWKVTLPGEQEAQSSQPYGLAEPESRLAQIGRGIVGTGASVISGIAKLPMGVAQAAVDINQSLSSLTGQNQLTPEQYSGLREAPHQAYENIAQPIRSKFREGYLEPQGPVTKGLYKVAESTGYFLDPQKLLLSPIKAIVQAGVQSIGSASGKKLAKIMGFGDFGQAIGSIAGSGTASFLANKGSAAAVRQFTKDTQSQSFDNIEKQLTGVSNNTVDLTKQADHIYRELEKGQKNVDWKERVRVQLRDLLEKISTGKSDAYDLFQSRQDFNGLIRNARTGEEKAFYSKIANLIGNNLKENNSKIPGFIKNFEMSALTTKLLNTADEAYSILQEVMSAKGVVKAPLIKRMFAATEAPREALYFLSNTPGAKKFYAKAWSEAIAGNSSGVKNAIRSLDHIYDKEGTGPAELEWEITMPGESPQE